MGMPTAVNLLKKKLEAEAGIEFLKVDDLGNHWQARLDGEVLVEKKRTLSEAVWSAACKVGEPI